MNMAEAMMVRALTETGAGLDMTKYILRQTERVTGTGSLNKFTVFTDISWDWCLLFIEGHSDNSAYTSQTLHPLVRTTASGIWSLDYVGAAGSTSVNGLKLLYSQASTETSCKISYINGPSFAALEMQFTAYIPSTD